VADLPGGKLGEPDGDTLGTGVGKFEGAIDGSMIGAWVGLELKVGLLVIGARVGLLVSGALASPRNTSTSAYPGVTWTLDINFVNLHGKRFIV
jgi:hypothetical protein